MIKGLDIFKRHFENYKDQYVLIGGAACDILMDDAEKGFRATKDLDLVLIIESLTPEFGIAFWKFIEEGRYSNRCRSQGKPQFYRFDKPEKTGYPFMLELFSKQPPNLSLAGEGHTLVPLHIDAEVSSLSAILLNESYYQMLLAGRRELNGVTILNTEYLIIFKAKAWLDLTAKRNSGIHVDEADIKKHKNDIVRLATIVEGGTTTPLPEDIKKDMERFIVLYINEPIDLKTLRIRNTTNEEIINLLKDLFAIKI